MALEIYRKKRQFGVTAEPRGRKGRRAGNQFVIQKHAARRLHYDLRLELDGVMKSWAVTRGPSLDPDQKRLAVQVEDHPIEYNTFEGTIPDGEYGGGAVMIWDRGRWSPDGDPHKGFAKGHLVFDLDGEKLHGRWHLVRMHGRAKDRHENWLLIKSKDEDARTGRGKDVLEDQSLSVVTGRSIEEIAAGKGKKRVWHSNRAADQPAQKQKTAKRAKAPPARASATRGSKPKRALLPDFVPPSLATLHSGPPSGVDWIHEIKFDGYRIAARLDRGEVQLLTRNRQDWTHRFQPIADAVAALPATTALLDGELVVEDEKGISSFSLLQTDLKDDRSDRFVYWAFDLLHLDGRDLMQAPLIERKTALERLLKKKSGPTGKIRYAEHFEEDGATILKHACGMGLEGVVSKRSDALYRSGRSENFVKSKCHNRQEFVVVGFSPSAAMPRAVGALTVAFHEHGKLRYAGRLGTGYTHKTARDLWTRLEKLQTDRAPVALPPDERRKNVRWVKPQLVVEAEFRGVTHDGLLRQAAYKGLREDKPAREVVREAAEPADQAAMTQRQTTRKSPKTDVTSAAKSHAASAKQTAEVADVRLTHPQRIYWPDVGVTKKDLADYYANVWDWIAPHIIGRALSLVRAPAGVGGETFFQKHVAANIKSSPLRHVVGGKDHDVIAVETCNDLVALIQTAALEIHVRGSRLDSLETCDRVVFDLDPGEGVSWTQMIVAARETRERLKAEELESFVKLSGGKGLHVVAPIADVDWDDAKAFTQRIASAMAADSPKLYLAKMTKSLRRGRVFIDYFRNSREATAVAPYSTRARAGAPVSAPVTWEQLGRTTGGNQFGLLDLKKHFKKDPWAGIGKVRQKLPVAAKGRR